MDVQTLQKDNADLQKQNKKRNLVIAGFMIAGAAAGFAIAKSMKGKALVQVGATIGGSLLLGVPVLLMTRKKALERTKKIKDNETQIAGLQNVNSAVNTIASMIPDKSIVDSITNVVTPKPIVTAPLKPGSGVLTVEEQNKGTNPTGTVSLNKMV